MVDSSTRMRAPVFARSRILTCALRLATSPPVRYTLESGNATCPDALEAPCGATPSLSFPSSSPPAPPCSVPRRPRGARKPDALRWIATASRRGHDHVRALRRHLRRPARARVRLHPRVEVRLSADSGAADDRLHRAACRGRELRSLLAVREHASSAHREGLARRHGQGAV